MTPNEFWWDKSSTKLNDKVFNTMRSLESQHASRLEEYYIYASQYASTPQRRGVHGLTPFHYGRLPNHIPTKRIRYNMIRSALDTLSALAASDRPRPLVLTEDGTAIRMRQAKLMSKYFLGIFGANRVYEQGPVVFRDAGLFGLGLLKVGIDSNGEIKICRVFAGEIFYDLVDAHQGQPRSLHHRWWIPRAVAMKAWPNKAAAIRDCESYTDRIRDISSQQEDFIEVIESWHLPSRRDAKDGLHTICIQTSPLVHEVWGHNFFPFATYRWGDPIYGFESEGAAAMLAGHQVAINNHLANMEEALNRFTVPRVWIDSASNVSFEMLDNRIGGVFKYDSAGQPPIFDTPRALEAAWVDQTRWYIQSGFEMIGISQFSIGGAPPEGISSGTALREFSDQVNARWRYYQYKYEDLYVQLAKIVFSLAKAEYDKGNNIKATVRGRRFIQKIDFKQINLDEDLFEISVMPTSMLPKTPGARFATLDEYFSKGYISKEEVLEMAEIPDLERANSFGAAPLEDIDIMIDKMLFDEVPESELPEDLIALANEADNDEDREFIIANYYYIPPHPMQNIEAAKRRIAAAWADFRWTDVKSSRLELLVRWDLDAQQLITPPGMPELPPGQGLGSSPDGQTAAIVSQTPQGMMPGASLGV